MTTSVDSKLIHLQDIRILHSEISCEDHSLNCTERLDGYNIGIGQSTKLNVGHHRVQIILKISVVGIDNEKKPVGANGIFLMRYQFQVDNLEDLTTTQDDMIKVDRLLGITLLSIAYSTTRGLIFDRTQGTFLKSLVLPIIDPASILDSPIK